MGGLSQNCYSAEVVPRSTLYIRTGLTLHPTLAEQDLCCDLGGIWCGDGIDEDIDAYRVNDCTKDKKILQQYVRLRSEFNDGICGGL